MYEQEAALYEFRLMIGTQVAVTIKISFLVQRERLLRIHKGSVSF